VAHMGSVEIYPKWLAKVFTKRGIQWLFVVTHLVHIVAHIGIYRGQFPYWLAAATVGFL